MECNALKESLKIIREDITEKYNQMVKEEFHKKDQTITEKDQTIIEKDEIIIEKNRIIQKLQQENQQLKNDIY